MFVAMTDFWLLPIQVQAALVVVGLLALALVIRVFVNLYDFITLGREGRLALKTKTKHFWEKSA